jgi:hypothetical protein
VAPALAYLPRTLGGVSIAPTGALRPSAMGGADMEVGPIEVDGSVIESVNAEVEPMTGVDDPPEAD